MLTCSSPSISTISSRDSSQTAPSDDCAQWRSSARITLAVHPWHGETVGVVRIYGSHAVCVERETGARRIIPASWTSLVPQVRYLTSDGKAVRIGPQAAHQLAHWIAARRGAEHGER